MIALTAYHSELFAVLVVLSVTYSALVRHRERLRRGLTDGYVAHSLDIWIMAGVLLLPLSLLTALVIVVYAAEWPSRKIVGGGRPKRYTISASINLLAALAGSEVHSVLVGLVGLPAAILAWSAVNDILIAIVMAAGGSRPEVRRLLSARNHVFDLATKLAGVLLALLLGWHVPLAITILPLFLLGHRIALRDSIRETNAFDPASGLWSESAWWIHAEHVIAEAPASVVLMLIDPSLPEQESRIFSVLGSLFSPYQAAQIDLARPLSMVIGHYGTRQVALLSEVDVDGAGVLLAKHVRERLKKAGIACVVGASTGFGYELDDLLIRAGADLMRRRAEAGVSVRW